MPDELGDAAGVFEFQALVLARFRIGSALVSERDEQALVEERQLAQALRQRIRPGVAEEVRANESFTGAATLRGWPLELSGFW